MANFPNFPFSGKNSKVEISTSDGLALSLTAMTKQASYVVRGETYTDRVYLLGAGKTLINMRPAYQPDIDINGIIEGLNITPGAVADTVAVSSGTIEVDGESVSVSADSALALSNAAVNSCWNAITVQEDGTLNVVKGTDGATLLDTFGDAAGERPLIPLDELLIGWVEVGTTPDTITASDINNYRREWGGVDYQMLPNEGGVLLSSALYEIHSATIGGTASARAVKFTGNYLDDVMAVIGTASEWALNSESDDASETTFSGGYNSSTVSGFTATFNQLTADKKVVNAVFSRQGHCAVRITFPNGWGWQSAATVTFSITNPATGYSSMTNNVSLLDFPAEYTGD